MAYETARLAQAEGIRNCFVSNGFMTELAVETISPVLDAINVDLKAFRDETYRSVMKARLAPVLRSMKALAQAGVWLEVTTLVVPGMNDSPQELGEMASWIASELGPHVPWHVSRFHGDYNMTDRPRRPWPRWRPPCAWGARPGSSTSTAATWSGDPRSPPAAPPAANSSSSASASPSAPSTFAMARAGTAASRSKASGSSRVENSRR